MNKLDDHAKIRALRAVALEDLQSTSDIDLALEALADEEQIETIAARDKSMMLSAAATALSGCRGAEVSENPAARSFEQTIQALVQWHFGPHVTAFADGPDGVREATFEGRAFYSDCAEGWAGKGVLQVKFRQVSNRHADDATWLINVLDDAISRYRREGNRLRHPEGTVDLIEGPQYYVLITNLSLSSIAEKGGKDKVIARLEEYRRKLGWKDYDLWDGDKIRRLLSDAGAIHRQGSASEYVQAERSASAVCAIEAASQDTLVCSYIRDEELPDELRRRVRACAMAITHNREAVKEIEQQVKLKLLTVDRQRWEQVGHKWGYVIRIAQNESRTWLRCERRQLGTVMSRKPHEREVNPINRAVPDWDIKALQRLLGPLDRECAEVVIRAWVFGRSVRTVGLKMNLPVSRIQAHLSAATRYYTGLAENNPTVPSLFDRVFSLFRRGPA
jgi:DNA-directed RNA polymerase specialized sigma24 family protein